MVTVNLIPEPMQAAQGRRRHLQRWGVLVAVAAAASVLPVSAHWAQHTRIRELQAINDQLQAGLASARVELKTITAEANDVFLRAERAKALRAKRNWSGMLALIASCLPPECRLTSLGTDPDVPPAAPAVRKLTTAGTPANPPGPSSAAPEKPQVVTIEAPRKLRIVGQATEATQPLAFAAKLKDTRVFRDVTLERSHREGDDRASCFRFELTCEW